MIPELRYNQHSTTSCQALLLRGNDVDEWMQNISDAGLTPGNISCYFLPVSRQHANTGGLFVTCGNTISVIPHTAIPYQEAFPGVFIPQHAELYPVLLPEEMIDIFSWHMQIIHPTLGMIGFEEKDIINLNELITATEPLNEDWSYAHPGIDLSPAFTTIQVELPKLDEVMEQSRADIKSRSFLDIPKEKEFRWWHHLTDPIKRVFFTILSGLLAFLSRLVRLLAGNFTSPGQTTSTREQPAGNGRTLLNQLEQWITRNLADIEKRRDSELKRLLKMFENNPDEALKYAIPLDSPYLNRGKGMPTYTLERRSTIFNVRSLGGGYAVDSWDVGDHYTTLRDSYRKSAQHEVERGNHRKAAYIYANLLGDYHEAARTLAQGGFYREAAVIWQEHLKLPILAAECLEEGGLYVEAVAIYKELNMHEKAGDLYVKAGQQEKAIAAYKKVVERAIDSGSYFEAARIIKNKIQDDRWATIVYFEGWMENNHAEKCLQEYFAAIRRMNEEPVPPKLREVYENYTTPAQERKFLEVMRNIYQEKNSTDEEDTIREIALQICSNHAHSGARASLQELRHFFPEDNLISSDVSRYIHSSQQSIKNHEPASIQLDPDIRWFNAISHRNQILALGYNTLNNLELARISWEGTIERHNWPHLFEKPVYFSMLYHDFDNKHVILRTQGNHTSAITNLELPRDKYFDKPVLIMTLPWLKDALVSFDHLGDFVKLDVLNSKLVLDYLDQNGVIKKSVTLTLHGKQNAPFSFHGSKLESVFGRFILFGNKNLFLLNPGLSIYSVLSFESAIRMICTSATYSVNHVVVSTNQGCYLCNLQENEIHCNFQVFAAEAIPKYMVFISSTSFVIAEARTVTLYIISGSNVTPATSFTVAETIIAILPAYKRNMIGVLDEKGKITLVDMAK